MLSLRKKSQGKWSRLRAKILKRDHYLCQPCDKQGKITVAQEVDHIQPIHKGGSDNPTNLQSICIECHKTKTQTDQGRTRRVSSACDVNGYPLSSKHHWNKQPTERETT